MGVPPRPRVRPPLLSRVVLLALPLLGACMHASGPDSLPPIEQEARASVPSGPDSLPPIEQEARASVPPVSAPPPELEPKPALITHRVARGETAWSIAQRYGLALPELARLNGLDDATVLRAGTQLMVPAPAEAPAREPAPAAAPAREPAPAAALPAVASRPPSLEAPSGQHRVEYGETLWRIAHRYGVAPEELARANRISDAGALAVGALLAIPGPACACGAVARQPEAPPALACEASPVLAAASLDDLGEASDPYEAIDQILSLADRYLDSAHFEESIDVAEVGLELLGDHWTRADAGPRIARAELLRGIAQMALEQTLESEASFRRALRVEPEIVLGPAASPKVHDAFEAVRSEVKDSLADAH